MLNTMRFAGFPAKHILAGYQKKWLAYTPAPNTKSALTIDFSESPDHFFLLDAIDIADSQNHPIPGRGTAKVRDHVFTFPPLHHWKRGKYSIIVNSTPENLAGNNLNRLFDRDIAKKEPAVQKCISKIFMSGTNQYKFSIVYKF